jgi:hypothetical protein
MVNKWAQSNENVKQFSERPNVNQVVVENFLMNMSDGGISSKMENLISDAKSNDWNKETIEAIMDGILTSDGLKISDIMNNVKHEK